ncbi:envelope glycoprotein [Folsomia candida]|uniref:Envelope glycoprotein n=2 Tax=Folsomia candida TaxID=158441 RepID=A0A226DH73_FOLCA|nr:envelope glycoprotein [Folsomia candida]
MESSGYDYKLLDSSTKTGFNFSPPTCHPETKKNPQNVQSTKTNREESLHPDLISPWSPPSNLKYRLLIFLSILFVLTAIVILMLYDPTTNYLPKAPPFCNLANQTRLVKAALLDLADPTWNFCGNEAVTLVLNNLKNPTNHSQPNINCPRCVKILNVKIDPFTSGEFDSILASLPMLESLTLLGPIKNAMPATNKKSEISVPITSLRLVDTSFDQNLFNRIANIAVLPCLRDLYLECSHPNLNETEGLSSTLKSLQILYPSLKNVHYENTRYPGVELLTSKESHVELNLVYQECF